jgi:hypothetical protein
MVLTGAAALAGISKKNNSKKVEQTFPTIRCKGSAFWKISMS